jgi:hypothetical protein
VCMVIQIVQHTMFNWLHATIERDGAARGFRPDPFLSFILYWHICLRAVVKVIRSCRPTDKNSYKPTLLG